MHRKLQGSAQVHHVRQTTIETALVQLDSFATVTRGWPLARSDMLVTIDAHSRSLVCYVASVQSGQRMPQRIVASLELFTPQHCRSVRNVGRKSPWRDELRLAGTRWHCPIVSCADTYMITARKEGEG